MQKSNKKIILPMIRSTKIYKNIIKIINKINSINNQKQKTQDNSKFKTRVKESIMKKSKKA